MGGDDLIIEDAIENIFKFIENDQKSDVFLFYRIVCTRNAKKLYSESWIKSGNIIVDFSKK